MNGHTNGATTNSPAIVAGFVEGVNGSGFLVRGTWWNVSKFAKNVTTMPRTGDEIRAELDRQGFVRRLEVLNDSAAVSDKENGVHNGAHAALPTHQAPDSTSARIAALSAAVAVLAALPVRHPARQSVEAAGDAVLDLAARFAAWVQE